MWRIISLSRLWAESRSDIHHLFPHSTVYNSVSWPHLTVRDSVGWLKQYPLTSSWFYKSEVRVGLAGGLIRVSQGHPQGVGQLGVSLRGCGKEFASRLILVAGRLQFLVVRGLESLVSCWLSARGCFPLLEGSLKSLHVAPSISVTHNFSQIKSPLCFESLWLQPSAEAALKGLIIRLGTCQDHLCFPRK